MVRRTPGAVEAGIVPPAEVKEDTLVQEIVDNVVHLEKGDRDMAGARARQSEEEGRWVEEACDKPEGRPDRHYRRLLVEAGSVSIVAVVDTDPEQKVEDTVVAVVGFTGAETASKAIVSRERFAWEELDAKSRS